MGDRRAAAEMHTAHCRSVCREEFGCQALAHSFTRMRIPSGAVQDRTLSRRVWKLSGTVRVNEHNCKDCPKTDGKQRPEWD